MGKRFLLLLLLLFLETHLVDFLATPRVCFYDGKKIRYQTQIFHMQVMRILPLSYLPGFYAEISKLQSFILGTTMIRLCQINCTLNPMILYIKYCMENEVTLGYKLEWEMEVDTILATSWNVMIITSILDCNLSTKQTSEDKFLKRVSPLLANGWESKGQRNK